MCALHVPPLYALALAVTQDPARAETAVVAAFAVAVTRTGRIGTATDGHLRHDLARLTYLRCATDGANSAERTVEGAAESDESVDQAGSHRSQVETTLAALRVLSATQRAVLGLCMFGDHTYRQAADLLAMPADTAAALLCSGLRELSPLLVGVAPAPSGPDTLPHG
ncbi:MAG: RNA polymerase sigma factor [Nocardioidaceae bacterium]